MISLTLARKYAKAFLEVGRREKSHELLGKDLEKMAGLFQENKELRAVLFSPFYPPPRRKAIAQTLGESLGLTRSTIDFINLLIERDRMDHFPAMVKAYEGLCDEVSNRLRAPIRDLGGEAFPWARERDSGAFSVLNRKRGDPLHPGGSLFDWGSGHQNRKHHL